MAAVSKTTNTSASSNEFSNTNISKNTLIEKVKKLTMPILIIAGFLIADIGAAFLNVSMPVLGGTIVTSAIGLIAYAILQIKNSKKKDFQNSDEIALEKKK